MDIFLKGKNEVFEKVQGIQGSCGESIQKEDQDLDIR